MDKVNAFLSSEDAAALQNMMNEMFLDVPTTLAIVSSSREQVVNFLAKALQVVPNWTVTRCAVLVERLTGAAMVAGSPKEYAWAWLYSVALCAEVDPGAVTLSDRQADIAFKLAHCWRRGGAPPAGAERPGPAAAAAPVSQAEDAEIEARATSPE